MDVELSLAGRPTDTGVLIIKPRLDLPFKDLTSGTIPRTRGHISPIREHWARFVDMLRNEHRRRDHTVMVAELPLWMMQRTIFFLANDLDVTEGGRRIVYVPHRDRADFAPMDGYDVRYYMQTNFPHCFTIDPHGWGASMSVRIDPADGDPNSSVFDTLKQRAARNVSKFGQPASRGPLDIGRPYVAFLCQIPHDQTIQKHSLISVIDALRSTLEWAQREGIAVVVKGHPINPGSMAPLKEMSARHAHAIWMDDVSIHDVIRGAQACFTVNSGSGMEAMLHDKPVFIFGRAEYEQAVIPVLETTIDGAWEYAQRTKFDPAIYRAWFDAYYRQLYDTRTHGSFAKLA